ncbi:MAG: hypothetical protein QM808_00750 [Steroidobacteraceae bacterium]
MVNSTVRGKARWCALGLGLGLMSAPAFNANAANISTVFAFDLHYTAAGVVEGTGTNAGYLYGSTYDTSLTYGGSIYRVPLGGGEPKVIYQLQSTDGYSPQASMVVGTDGYLYGTTHYAPRVGTDTARGSGTIFRLSQDGSGYTTLHTFTYSTTTNSTTGIAVNDDGIYPDRALIQDATYLYGTTSYGGLYGSGTVFRVRKSDGAFTVLHHFAAVDSVTTGLNAAGEGAYPSSSLTLASDGRLYGVTSGGGPNLKTAGSADSITGYSGTGTIYSLRTDGTDFQTVYAFSALDDTAAGSNAIGVNLDGVQPNGSLLEVSSGVLIGTTTDGGTPTDTSLTGYGTIFSFATGTKQLTTLYNFDSTTGATPSGNLILDNGRVYGITSGGSSDAGTSLGNLYAIDVAGTNFSNVHPFVFTEGTSLTGSLIKASNGDLFGTASYGNACTSVSSSGYGAVFRWSLATGQSSSGYASCTTYTSSSGGGAMQPGFLWLLAALGLAPPVRRRLFGFHKP